MKEDSREGNHNAYIHISLIFLVVNYITCNKATLQKKKKTTNAKQKLDEWH